LQSGQNAVFALDLVRGFADEFSWGFLAQDELGGCGVGELVCGVALAETELEGVRALVR